MNRNTTLQGVFARFALCLLCTFASLSSNAQRITWSVTGTTEGLWNITDGKVGWCNLLEAGMQTGLWKGASLDLAALATYNLNTPVADDLQVFSNLDAGPDKAFRLIQAGLSQQIGEHFMVFAGLRNVDFDYFTTPSTGLFTNASHGILPVLTANFPIATFPVAALCLHTEIRPVKGLIIRESVYNGTASDRLDEQFRFCPKSEGVFNIGSVSYYTGESEEEHTGHYTLGYALGTSPAEGIENDLTYNYALWALIEQDIVKIGRTQLSGLLQGGAAPATRSSCRGYWGAGLLLGNITKNEAQIGIVVNRALYADGRETDVELTGSFPICKYFTLQPAVHCINTNGHYTAAAQLRAIVEIGN